MVPLDALPTIEHELRPCQLVRIVGIPEGLNPFPSAHDHCGTEKPPTTTFVCLSMPRPKAISAPQLSTPQRPPPPAQAAIASFRMSIDPRPSID